MGIITKFHDLGLAAFCDILQIQQKWFESSCNIKKSGGHPENHLIFCEHFHIYTLGKSGEEKNLLKKAEKDESFPEMIRVNRGGDITYHGPGQLVIYPIIDLDQFGLSIRKYIEYLEESVIQTLLEFDIKSGRLANASGVWIEDGAKPAKKICALGVRASRGITMHGLALNVNTDLSFFNHINPCGFTNKSVTSIKMQIGENIDFRKVKTIILNKTAELFGMDIIKES